MVCEDVIGIFKVSEFTIKLFLTQCKENYPFLMSART